MKIEDFPREEIDNAKRLVSECYRVCDNKIPSLPKEIEDNIDEAMDKFRSESLRQHGNEDAVELTLPIYKQMMRLGALVALVYAQEKKGK